MGLAWHIIFFFLGCFVSITIYDSRQVVGRQENQTDRFQPTGTCILMREESESVKRGNPLAHCSVFISPSSQTYLRWLSDYPSDSANPPHPSSQALPNHLGAGSLSSSKRLPCLLGALYFIFHC